MMAKLTKSQKVLKEKVTPGRQYSIADSIALLKSVKRSTFTESFDVAVNLGVDTKKSDQVVRGAVLLPHGTGKTVRVAAFAQGANVAKAQAAGADIVGFEDLAEQIKGGKINFDILIATPDAMRIVGQLGQILGPRGLMPNPKVGTVTTDIETAIRNAKGGQVQYRADKGGIVHCAIGHIDFESQALVDNLSTLLEALKRAKPSTSKGIYIKKITVSTTMGPGVVVDQSSLSTIGA
jgi:large subunit ribosomal protein L1